MAGATYTALEFDWPAVEALNVDERIALCNKAAEAGAEPISWRVARIGHDVDTDLMLPGACLTSASPRRYRIGTVTLVRRHDRPFDPQGVGLLRLLVDQMAVTVQNARDFRDKPDQVIRDPLTGPYNRRFLLEALEKEVSAGALRRRDVARDLRLDDFSGGVGARGPPIPFVADAFEAMTEPSLRQRRRRRRRAGRAVALCGHAVRSAGRRGLSSTSSPPRGCRCSRCARADAPRSAGAGRPEPVEAASTLARRRACRARTVAPPAVSPMSGGSATAPRRLLMVGVALALVGMNLRFGLASLPPVVDDIRRDLGLSNLAAAVLTSAPVLCFGAAAPLAPPLARRLGLEPLLLACMLVAAGAMAARAVPAVVPLLAATLLLGVAIAIANVVAPSIIRRRFRRPGAPLGVYTTAFSVGAALAAAFTVPLEEALGSWRWALAFWGVPGLTAAAAWAFARGRAVDAREAAIEMPVALRRDRMAWFVTGSFGLQSALFFATLAWLPDILRDAGLSSLDAGAMLSIAMVAGVPVSLAVPPIAGRLHDQRALAVCSPALWAAGLVGLLVAPHAGTPVWATLLGLGQGSGLSLALALVVLRSPDASHTTSLSAMAQGVGYSIAAAGPLLAGALREASGDWTWPLAGMLAATLGLLACTLAAARPISVGNLGPRAGRVPPD